MGGGSIIWNQPMKSLYWVHKAGTAEADGNRGKLAAITRSCKPSLGTNCGNLSPLSLQGYQSLSWNNKLYLTTDLR